MGWFSTLLRRPRGRHAVGATVIPPMCSAAVAAPSEPWPSAPLPFAAALPVAPVLAAPIAEPSPSQPSQPSGPLFVPDRPQLPAPPAPAGTAGAPLRRLNSRARVQLGFRDGSTAVLDPTCEQAHALEELALLLSRRE